MTTWPAVIRAVAIALTAVAVWYALVIVFALPPYILPGPMLVGAALWEFRDLLAWHASVTLLEIVVGLSLGTALGMAAAIVMAAWHPIRSVLQPMLVFSQTIPVFALAPILTLWLGYGLWSKVVMALLIIFFPITSAFFDGLMRTRPEWWDLGRNARATPLRLMFMLRVPAAVPSLVTGLRVATVYAPIGAVIGEWVGASQGLGYLMLFANGRAKIDLMFAALLVLAAITLLLNAAVNLLCSKLLKNYLA